MGERKKHSRIWSILLWISLGFAAMRFRYLDDAIQKSMFFSSTAS